MLFCSMYVYQYKNFKDLIQQEIWAARWLFWVHDQSLTDNCGRTAGKSIVQEAILRTWPVRGYKRSVFHSYLGH